MAKSQAPLQRALLDLEQIAGMVPHLTKVLQELAHAYFPLSPVPAWPEGVGVDALKSELENHVRGAIATAAALENRADQAGADEGREEPMARERRTSAPPAPEAPPNAPAPPAPPPVRQRERRAPEPAQEGGSGAALAAPAAAAATLGPALKTPLVEAMSEIAESLAVISAECSNVAAELRRIKELLR